MSTDTRSGSTSEELLGNLQHKPAETENKNKNEGREEVQSDRLHDLPDWLQDFRENLVDERSLKEPRRNPAPKDRDTASSSHELPMESRARVEQGSGKHGVYRHFPKDPNCDICLKRKITKSSCRRRAATVVPRAENFGDLITADHKILSEGCESRHNHRYAVVVQDLATQWFLLPMQNQHFPEDPEEPYEVPEADEETKKSFTLTNPWNLASLVRNYPGIIVRQRHTYQKQRVLQEEQCAE